MPINARSMPVRTLRDRARCRALGMVATVGDRITHFRRHAAGVPRPAVTIAPMLDRDLVSDVLVAARRKGGDVAEVFVEERSNTSVRLDDGKVEELTTGLDRGAGVRVAHGTSYGYAFSNRLDRDALLQAAEAASAALTGGSAGSVVDLRESAAAGVNRA